MMVKIGLLHQRVCCRRLNLVDSYSPLFSKIVDSSLWSESDLVVKVFITLLAKKDSDHVVRGSAFQIGKWAGKDEAQALEALKVLSSPDTKRIEPQPHDGRRIKKVEEGWLILNGQVYEDLLRKMNRRIYKARKEREYREKKVLVPSRPLPGEPENVRRWANGEQPDPHP